MSKFFKLQIKEFHNCSLHCCQLVSNLSYEKQSSLFNLLMLGSPRSIHSNEHIYKINNQTLLAACVNKINEMLDGSFEFNDENENDQKLKSQYLRCFYTILNSKCCNNIGITFIKGLHFSQNIFNRLIFYLNKVSQCTFFCFSI